MRLRRDVTVAGGLLLVLWAVGGVVGSMLARGSLDAVVADVPFPPEEIARYVWGLLARSTLLVVGGVAALRFLRREGAARTIFARFVGPAAPRVVGYLRILTSAVLLAVVVVEDVADTARLPRELASAHGLFALFAAVPGFERFASSEVAVSAFEGISVGTLALAMLGVRPRWTVPLGALFYFVAQSLLRQPTWAYHTGLIPLYLMTWLALAPWLGAELGVLGVERREARDTEAAGWVRFGWVMLLFLPYVEAGLSKLCNAGPEWVSATNMRAILYMDSLDPMHFDFDGGLWLRDAPDPFFVALGVAGMVGEILMVLALVSRRGKRWMPAAMAGMHVGILLLQNVIFLDLIALLVGFYGMALLFDRGTGSPFDLGGGRSWPVAPRRGTRRAPRTLGVIVAVMAVFWGFAVEWFPFTAMQMYARVRPAEVEYTRVLELREEGWVRARPERVFPSLADGRYRRALRRCFEDDPRCAVFARAYLAEVPEVEALRVEKRRWRFEEAPDDGDFGETIGEVELRR